MVAKQLGRYVGKENILEGKRLRGFKKRTMWRSKGMKASYEVKEEISPWQVLQGNFFDSEGNPLYTIEEINGVFRVIRKGV